MPELRFDPARALYYPLSKTFLSGEQAEAAWRQFEAEAADETMWNQ